MKQWLSFLSFRLILQVASGLALGAALALIVSSFLQEGRTRAFDIAIQREIDVQRLMLDNIIDFHRQTSENYFETFIRPQEYLKRYPDLLSLNRHDSLHARLLLHQELEPTLKILRERGVDGMGIFSPDERVVFRTHLPEIAGDKLIKPSKLFLSMRESLKPRYGFVVGSTTVGYKSLFPLVEQNSYAGAIELNTSLASIIKKIQASDIGKEAFVIFKNDERIKNLLHSTNRKPFPTAFDPSWVLIEGVCNTGKVKDHLETIKLLTDPRAGHNNAPLILLDDNLSGQVFRLHDAISIVTAVPIREYQGGVIAQLITISSGPELSVLDSYYNRLIEITQVAIMLLTIITMRLFYLRSKKTTQRKRWESIATHIGEGVFFINQQGRITYASPRSVEILGYSESEFLGASSHELFHYHQGNRYLRGADCPILATQKTGVPYHGHEYFKCRNGTLIVVDVMSYLFDEAGEKIMAVVFRDITELNEKLEIIDNQEAQLKRLEKISNNLHGFCFEFFIHTTGKDSFIYASAGTERLLGVKPEKLEDDSSHFWNRLSQEDQVEIRALFLHAKDAATISKKRYRFQATYGERWIEISAAPYHEEGGARWYGYVRDATEHHHIEESLKESQQRWEFALEGSGDGIWDWDISNNNLYLSPRLGAMFGYAPEEIAHATLDTAISKIHDDDKERFKENLYLFLSDDRTHYSDEYRVFSKGGETRWILARGAIVQSDSEGKPLRMLGVCSDITERHQMEEALSDFNRILGEEVEYELAQRLDSERSFRTLFEKSPEGFLILDREGIVLEANQAAEVMLGYGAREMEGHWIFEDSCQGGKPEPIDPSELNQAKERIYQNLAGEEVLIETILTPVRLEGQERIFALWRDITEVRRLEQAREREQAYLIQQSKQAELGSMIGAITHQWKQPLNVLSILVQNIELDAQENTLKSEMILKDCEKMMEMVEFMSMTMEDFRNFFKPSKEKEAFALIKAIASVGNILHSEFNKAGITLAIEGDKALLAYGYSGEFKQVVLNILNNAKDAFNERQTESPRIMVSVEESGENLVARFLDNGGGIAEHLLPNKIFEPFSSTKGAHGMGIGLSLSKVIIEEKMGGKLRAYNDKGGAVFEITLPRGEVG